MLCVSIVFCLVGISSGAMDLRVSKGMYTRSYDTVRLSVISDASDPGMPFSYNAPFVHRWPKKSLSTKLLQVGPKGTNVSIAGETVTLSLSAAGRGVTGVIFSDPCFTGKGGLACPNGDRFQILDRLTKLVNQLVSSDEVDFWAILGDNFYDQRGEVTAKFFEKISIAAKAKPFITVPGNHDFWIGGGPVGVRSDQLGYGFMQFYGQDTFAATETEPYDFSGNPDALQIAKASNFNFGSQVGDVAFFGFSGSGDWSATEPHAASFCKYVGATATVNTVVLVGHWNKPNLGCHKQMDTPSVYDFMKNMTGCREKLMLYFEGHEHCNRVTKQTTGPADAIGFMVGASGMNGNCPPQFGFAVLQSDPDAEGNPSARVDYFELATQMEKQTEKQTESLLIDRFEDIYTCFKARSYAECRDLYSSSWRSMPSTTTTTTGRPPSIPRNQLFWIIFEAVGGTLGILCVVGCFCYRRWRKHTVMEARARFVSETTQVER